MLVSERAEKNTNRSFDSLAYAKHMEAAGFTRQQAEALAEEQAKLIDERLATKSDINVILTDLERIKAAFHAENEQLRTVVKSDLRELELRLQAQVKDLQIRVGGMIVGLGGILIAIKYFG